MFPHQLKIKSVLFVLVFIICSIPSFAFPDAEKIFKENSKAVVVVVTFDEQGEPLSQGSGFIVRPDGAVVTNYHVISNAKDIKIKAGNKILDVEGIIHKDKDNDLVIIKSKGKNLPAVKLGDIEKEIVGEKIYVISSPQGLENTISDGLLSGIREITDKKKVLQITAPISSGSSGSPVFNAKGEVIGISTFLLKKSQNLNFAMPINLIADKINNTTITKLKDSHIKTYEKTAEYWYFIGLALLLEGKYQEAVDAYKQAIRIKPDFAIGHLSLGAAYAESGNYLEAVDAYKQAIRIKPDFAAAHYSLGMSFGALDKYQEEVDAYKQAIRIKPDYADAHHYLGLTYSKSGNYQEAVDAFKQAIRIEPDHATAHAGLGGVYMLLNKYQEAVDAFKQAIRIKPDITEAHYGLGGSYRILDKYQEAVDAYKQAIRIKPDHAKAHNFLGVTYGILGKYQEAVDAFKQAIRIKPDFADANYFLGAAYGILGKYQESVDAYKQATKLKTDYADAHYNLGLAYLMINDKGSAFDEYTILKELDKERANNLFNLIYP